MESTLTLHISNADIFIFRRAISIMNPTFNLTTIENKDLTGIIFTMKANSPEAFYKLGYAAGTMKEFLSKKA